MVPMARGADFDHITGKIAIFRALSEGLEFFRRRDATAKRWQSRAEDIRHEHQILVLTNRTRLRRWLTHLTSSTNKFGMGVTHFVLRQTTLLVFRNEMLARESIIDLAAFAARGTAERS